MTPPLAGERQGRCLDCRCGLYVHIGAQTRCEGVQKKKKVCMDRQISKSRYFKVPDGAFLCHRVGIVMQLIY